MCVFGGGGDNGAAEAAREAARAQIRAAQAQAKAARDASAMAPSASETSKTVTAAVQQNRRRLVGMQGMDSTVTGAANNYSSGGSKSLLGS